MAANKISVNEISPYLSTAEIIDVRSPGEYAEDFIPGAKNHPVLDNDERAQVGAINKQQSPFEAKRFGAALVTKNIGEMIEQHFATKPNDWSPLVYCWRGGKRSGVATHILREIGFNAVQLDGGYKAFRGRVNDELPLLSKRFNYVTICGVTGTGKTALLHALANAGAQTVDLEGLAKHRGSLLGDLPNEPQPSQKRFDTLLWSVLSNLDPTKPVYVESESKKIGLVQMPEAMREQMQAGECVWLHVPLAARIDHIKRDYAHFVADPLALVEKLQPLKPLRGAKLLNAWRSQAIGGDIDALFASLMIDHYDPLYTAAITKNFLKLSGAQQISLSAIEGQPLSAGAAEILNAAR